MQLTEPRANQILKEAERQCVIASQQWGVTFNSPSWAQDAQGVYVILYARRDRGKYLSVRVSDEDLEDYPEEPEGCDSEVRQPRNY